MDPEANPVVHLVTSHSSHKDHRNGEAGASPTLDKTPQASELADLGEDDPFPGDQNALAAWVVLLGSFLALFASFGLMVSIGTLQEYWQFHQLSDYTASEVGWIPSVFVYLALGLGILFGPIFDRFGPRWILLIGSAAYVVMMFLLAECSKYWHFILCLGLLGGPAAAALTTTALAAVSHWFKDKRGLASGIVSSPMGKRMRPAMW